MKRLGVYAFIAITLLITVGGFTGLRISFAAAPFDSAQTEIINAFGSKEAVFQAKYNDNQKKEYQQDYNALKGILASHAASEPADLDSATFQIRALNDFMTYLSGRMAVQSDADLKQVLSDANALADALHTDISAGKFDQAYYNAAGAGGPVANAEQTKQNATKQVAATKQDGAAPVGKCSLVLPTNITACIDEGFSWLIKNTILQIAGFLVWLAANMLNYAIQISILGFSSWAPDTLYPVHVVVRQIVSLFVVFAGLWLGFMYILGDETKFAKYMGWIVLFALFVNFSYPFTRALVDVSNIISLNVYSATVGSKTLETNFSSTALTPGTDTAGSMIMSRLGLQGLAFSATQVTSGSQKGFVEGIDSTPGALIAVAFVLYAAYIFFMATAIIVTRMAVLVFLIVASPLLLVDSVIPKLGDAAVKMRKMFFEQLVVAPVFMIMLALTLKFMEIFQDGGPLLKTTASGLKGDSIQTFFSILMMLIMLHIMIKVTKSIAGTAGEYATKFMGKVGGFGLGMATGGAGMLARGSIGAAAARMRDSDWMKNNQDSKIGRGMHSLTNSLAQSTYDVRNVGAVSSRMSKAGMGMGDGSKGGYDADFKAKEQKIRTKASYITDSEVRDRYLGQMANTIGARTQRVLLSPIRGESAGKSTNRNDAEIIRDKINKERDNIIKRYQEYESDDNARKFLANQTPDMQKILETAGRKRTLESSAEVPEVVVPAPAENVETGEVATSATDTTTAKKVADTNWDQYNSPAGNRMPPKQTATTGEKPASQTQASGSPAPASESTSSAGTQSNEPIPGFLLSGQALKEHNAKRRAMEASKKTPTV